MSGVISSQATTKKNEVNLEKLEKQFETKLISSQKDENEKESQYNIAKSESHLLLSTEQKVLDLKDNIKFENWQNEKINSCKICDKIF